MSRSGDILAPRDAAMLVAERLLDAGFQTLFAGGCVRDRLLGIAPADFDLATSARPDDVMKVFPRGRGVGAHFGVVLVPAGGRAIEVATFRADGSYHDGRRPTEVSFGDAEDDARRRDFTINGLFEDPRTGEVIDFVDGRRDLEAGLLRAIGEPEDRFEEDRLRMLRAVRFGARFDLKIDARTLDAITRRADRLGAVSRERVGQELRRMLEHSSRAVAAGLAESTGLDRSILGASRDERGTACSRLDALPAESISWIDALVAWELDRGTGLNPDAGDRLVRELVLSNREQADLVALRQIREALLETWAVSSVAQRKRLAARDCFDRALRLVRAEKPGLVTPIEVELEELLLTGIAPAPWVGGDDLVSAGLPPGPLFRTVLDQVYDAQLEGRLLDKESALLLAIEIATRVLGQPKP
ncbi:MAG: metal-dependent phosphohydrolase [Phycisphaerae bacterium]|nr:metal-dependent phosphohydrolase [Phycisphaerae bacterium]